MPELLFTIKVNENATTINTGQTAGPMLTQPLTLPAVISPSGDLNSGDDNRELMCAWMSQLNEIWQRTAARGQWTHNPLTSPVEGLTTVSAEGNEIIFAQINCFEIPPNISARRGSPNTYSLGAIEFLYGAYAGPLQRLNFEKSHVVPEMNGCTAIKVHLNPGVVAGVRLQTREMNCVPLSTRNGTSIDYGMNIPAPPQYQQALYGFCDFPKNDHFKLPYLDATNKLLLAPGIEVGMATSLLPPLSIKPTYAYISAMLAEIWEHTAGTRGWISKVVISETGGSAVHDGGLARIKYAQLFSEVDSPVLMEGFGLTDSVYIGQWCGEYNGYFGKLMYVNSRSQMLIPGGYGCTGIWLNMDPGVDWGMTLHGSMDNCVGIETDSGTVRLADNELLGLTW